MNIKLLSHIMPWDIDYALLMAIQLKKSHYYLSSDVNITIDLELNLTSYLYNWEESKIPKDYFIDKFNTLLLLLNDYKVNTFIYEGDQKYGHLDQQKNIISPETDYYIGVCPDTYFSEYTLNYMIELARQVTNKYFVITPQISKVGDEDWDKIVNPKYLDIPYSDYFCKLQSIYDKLKIFSLYKVRLIATMKFDGKNNLFHTDIENIKSKELDIKTAIYYINTTDGGTEFEHNNKIVESVSNRMVVFPYHLKHRTVKHKTGDDFRYVLNLNYIEQ